MDYHRFDALVRALQPANRRSLLGGAIGSVLGLTALALGQDEGDAARRHNRNNNNNRRRRRRRNRRRRSLPPQRRLPALRTTTVRVTALPLPPGLARRR